MLTFHKKIFQSKNLLEVWFFWKACIVTFQKSNIQAKIDFLKWYLSVNSSEIYGKFQGRETKFAFSLYTVETGTKFRLRFHCIQGKRKFRFSSLENLEYSGQKKLRKSILACMSQQITWNFEVIQKNPFLLFRFSANFNFGAKFNNEVRKILWWNFSCIIYN
jgi:hypothetical protein